LSQILFPINPKRSQNGFHGDNDCCTWYGTGVEYVVNSVASYIIHPVTESVMIHWRSPSRRVGTVKVRNARE